MDTAKHLSTDASKRQCGVYIYEGTLASLKEEEILSFVRMRMDLEDTQNKPGTEGQTPLISPMRHLKRLNSQEQREQRSLAEAGEGERGRPSGTRISVRREACGGPEPLSETEGNTLVRKALSLKQET